MRITLSNPTTTPEVSQNLSWKMTHSKRCPKCSILIQRDDGCLKMDCQYCGHKFCWNCLNEFDGGKCGFYKCVLEKLAEKVEGSEEGSEEIEGEVVPSDDVSGATTTDANVETVAEIVDVEMTIPEDENESEDNDGGDDEETESDAVDEEEEEEGEVDYEDEDEEGENDSSEEYSDAEEGTMSASSSSSTSTMKEQPFTTGTRSIRATSDLDTNGSVKLRSLRPVIDSKVSHLVRIRL